MNEKDLRVTNNIIVFPTKNVAQTTSNEYSTTRAKAFRIKSALSNFAQYVRTVRAYALAKMPFRHIANAAEFLGDEVTKNEVDAPVHEGWQKKAGEVVEDEHKILAWQTRDPEVSTVGLPSPVSITGREVVIVFNNPTTVPVVEGIKVSTNQDNLSVLPNSTPHDLELENNPYLKKAA